MHAAANNLRGGVSPRNTRLRGQSIIEYVLIIAVIGLVIVFVGPGVAGAIRNQLNQVTNTVDSGTDGDSFMSAEEKAYREAMKTVAQKEAKDWTLDEQKAAATDIAKNGTSSVVYAKAKAAMDAGTTWSVKLTNGVTMTYYIIGINHDDLADGSGTAGLTFWTTTNVLGSKGSQFNPSESTVGGWEKSELRTRMNNGDIWSLMPDDFKSGIKEVKKETDNTGGGVAGIPTVTKDRLFCLSGYEAQMPGFPYEFQEGNTYEFFKSNLFVENPSLRQNYRINCWSRSLNRNDKRGFVYSLFIGYSNGCNSRYANRTEAVCPAWCF